MDIHQEKWDYTAMLVAENAITQEQCDTLKLSDGMNIFYSDHLASTTIDCINWGWSSWLKAKAQAVPDLGELQERIAGHQYYHNEHGHMIVDMDDVVKEISGFDSWKAQAVPEGFVLVQEDKISHFYQDNDEPENFCNSSDDWDCLGDGIDKDQIMIVNKQLVGCR